jgi:hypothetical protein
MEYRFLGIATTVDCIFPSSQLSASYMGETALVGVFYDMIKSAHR